MTRNHPQYQSPPKKRSTGTLNGPFPTKTQETSTNEVEKDGADELAAEYAPLLQLRTNSSLSARSDVSSESSVVPAGRYQQDGGRHARRSSMNKRNNESSSVSKNLINAAPDDAFGRFALKSKNLIFLLGWLFSFVLVVRGISVLSGFPLVRSPNYCIDNCAAKWFQHSTTSDGSEKNSSKSAVSVYNGSSHDNSEVNEMQRWDQGVKSSTVVVPRSGLDLFTLTSGSDPEELQRVLRERLVSVDKEATHMFT